MTVSGCLFGSLGMVVCFRVFIGVSARFCVRLCVRLCFCAFLLVSQCLLLRRCVFVSPVRLCVAL